ncbi:MAG: tyrosine-type recombinase/integrase [Eubacteriales bacterium]|nr:tyrosine-type recombinase/integrase [Eubacteriales bacterium]
MWEVKRSYFKLTGDKKRKSFYSSLSYNDAVEKANEYESMLRAHQLVGNTLVSREATFEEWAEKWLELYKEGKVKESTYLETYERTVNSYLIPHFGGRRLDAIMQADVESLVKKFCDVYSETVMHKMRLCLNGIFDTAIDNDLCRKNPAKKVSFISNVDKKPKRTYSQAEANLIYQFCDKHPTGIYIRILLELGLRCSELCGLKWGDFDFKDKTVIIRRTTTRVNNKVMTEEKTKSRKNRTLPLSSELIKMLKPLKTNDDDFILSSSKIKGKAITPLKFTDCRYKTFFKDLKHFLEDDYKKRLQTDSKAKPVLIMKLTPHELRHTCGTLLYARTKDIYAVSKYLGHSSIEITAKLYVHDSAELLRLNLGIN